jgi:signal peptidase I
MTPLLSVWLRPGDTIDRVLAGSPRYSVWMLAVLGGTTNILASFSDAVWTTEISAWRLYGGFALLGAAGAIFALYFQALCLRWSGRLFGGNAPAKQLRALMAWGYFWPFLAGSVISLAVSAYLHFTDRGTSQTFDALLQSIILIWSFIIVVRMLARLQHFGTWRAIGNGITGLLLGTLVLLVFPVAIRTLLFQPFNSPSQSSMPTLLTGDQFFVSKYAYGYSHFSLPFSPPLFSGRIWAAEPKRGDLVVFRLPGNTSVDYVKRIIGLPGDRVQMIHGQLYINGQPVERKRVEDFISTGNKNVTPIKQWRETLPNGASYNTLDLVEDGFADNTEVYKVPPGCYFMLGDNRDNSTDSRFRQVGMVPFENLIGRVGIIYNSVARQPGSARQKVRFERIGMRAR